MTEPLKRKRLLSRLSGRWPWILTIALLGLFNTGQDDPCSPFNIDDQDPLGYNYGFHLDKHSVLLNPRQTEASVINMVNALDSWVLTLSHNCSADVATVSSSLPKSVSVTPAQNAPIFSTCTITILAAYSNDRTRVIAQDSAEIKIYSQPLTVYTEGSGGALTEASPIDIFPVETNITFKISGGVEPYRFIMLGPVQGFNLGDNRLRIRAVNAQKDYTAGILIEDAGNPKERVSQIILFTVK